MYIQEEHLIVDTRGTTTPILGTEATQAQTFLYY